MTSTVTTATTGSAPVPALEAVKTYRYVRLAMVAMVLGLAASIAVEAAKVPGDCFQHSISAYYYTPVRGFFVGALLAVGVCLVALRGNDDREDALLNLAGIFAPIVALVPTASPGDCSSLPGSAHDRAANVSNNVSALLVLGAVGLLVAVVIALPRAGRRLEVSVWSRVGFAVVLSAYLLALVSFFAARTAFLEKAHYAAAVAMFACIFLVVLLNALGLQQKQERAEGEARPPRGYANRYALIAWGMVLGGGGVASYNLAAGWDHAVLWVEGLLIALFAAFWLLQTHELWHQGLRREGAPPDG